MKFEKIAKILGDEVINNMSVLSKNELELIIVASEVAMDQAVQELDKNEKYQEIREAKKALEEGKKEVFKFQKAKIAMALVLLSEK